MSVVVARAQVQGDDAGMRFDERWHWKTDSLKCPWCGHEGTDSWEVPDGEDLEYECESCSKTFLYSTSRVFESWTEEE